MRNSIVKHGRFKVVLIITLIAIILAVSSNIVIAYILSHETLTYHSILRSIIIPLLIAPFISWYLIGLFIELDRLEQKMAFLAKYDDLTGLLNRKAFYEIAELIQKEAIITAKEYSILCIDFDHFKKINDSYGHPTGDEVLKLFGAIAKELSRQGDTIGRVGGEEFAFILPNTNLSQAQDFAQRLRTKVKETTLTTQKGEINFSVSIGLTTRLPTSERSLKYIFAAADKALYSAKLNGRDRIEIHSFDNNTLEL